MAADHSETPSGGQTYAFPGTSASISRVISALGGSSPETYDKADGIQVSTTTSTDDITITGHVAFYGVSLRTGDDLIISGAGNWCLFDDCIWETTRTNGGVIIAGSTGSPNTIILKNTNLNYSSSNANSGFEMSNGMVTWSGGTLSLGGSQPSNFFDLGTRTAVILLHGVDLSALTNPVVDASDSRAYILELHHCLINSTFALGDGAIAHPASRLLMNGCDDTTGNNLYRLEYTDFWGSTVDDDATFRTTGGATDPDGNAISWKMVSTGNAEERGQPTKSPPIIAWVDSTGSKTFKINCLWDSATDIQDDEASLKVEFLEASADTDSAFADDLPTDILTAPADQTTNAVAWTISPSMTNANEFELSVIVTVNRVGPVIAHVCLAKPSTTIFADPKLEIT